MSNEKLIDYASRIGNILNTAIPELIQDDSFSNSHRAYGLQHYKDVINNLLPLQTRYTIEDIRKYFLEVKV